MTTAIVLVCAAALALADPHDCTRDNATHTVVFSTEGGLVGCYKEAQERLTSLAQTGDTFRILCTAGAKEATK